MAETRSKSLDTLQLMFSNVLVQTGKAIRAASNGNNKAAGAQTNAVISARIPSSIETFNAALDNLESEIVRAKSVLLRDLHQLRAKPKRLESEARPVAPPAPMVIDIDLDSPKMEEDLPAANQSQASEAGTPANARAVKQESAPVAPFPNMGMDLTVSPEMTSASTPSPVALKQQLQQQKAAKGSPEIKRSPQPPAAQNRPASAPPRKETKVPVPQIPRSAASTPMPPASSAATQSAPMQASGPFNPPAPSNRAPEPVMADPEQIFTDMTFSLAAPAGDLSNSVAAKQTQPSQTQPSQSQPQPTQTQTQTQSQTQTQTQTQAPEPPQPEPDFDLANFDDADMGADNLLSLDSLPTGDGAVDLTMDLTGSGAAPGGSSAEDAKKLDDNIDSLFDLGSAGVDNMDLDYNLSGESGGGLNDSTFDELFYGTGDGDNVNVDFDDPYYGLEQ